MGAIALGNENGVIDVTNCIIENITGSASNTAIITVNGDSEFNLDNLVFSNCRLEESVAADSTASYLRSFFYVNTYGATVTISNSEITGIYGPMMSLFETRSGLTIVNTTIANNIVNTSVNGANGGDNLIWTSNDASNVNIVNCVITGIKKESRYRCFF